MRATNGQGTLVVERIAPAGGGPKVAKIFGQFSATVAVDVPNVSLGGTFTVQINNTGVSQTIQVGGNPVTLEDGLQIRADGVTLQVLDQKLSGNFLIRQTDRRERGEDRHGGRRFAGRAARPRRRARS